jgi:hypothetical protein
VATSLKQKAGNANYKIKQFGLNDLETMNDDIMMLR